MAEPTGGSGTDTGTADLVTEDGTGEQDGIGGDAESPAAKLDYLRDLFVRRLAQDRQSAKAFDALYAELKAARSTIDGMLVLPLARRMFMLIDRLDQDDSELALSVVDELADMLYFQGFTQIAVDSDVFDPATQEAVAVPVPPDGQDGQVGHLLRRGWLYQDRLIRPALVEVATAAVTVTSADG